MLVVTAQARISAEVMAGTLVILFGVFLLVTPPTGAVSPTKPRDPSWPQVWRTCSRIHRNYNLWNFFPGIFHTKKELMRLQTFIMRGPTDEYIYQQDAVETTASPRQTPPKRPKRSASGICDPTSEYEINSAYCTTCLGLSWDSEVTTVRDHPKPVYAVNFYDFSVDDHVYQYIPKANCGSGGDGLCSNCILDQIPVTLLVTDTPPHSLYGHNLAYITYFFNVWFEVVWTPSFCKCAS